MKTGSSVPASSPRWPAALRRFLSNRWILALLVTAVAMFARALIDPWLGESLPFLFALPAVLLIGRGCGLGPALLGTLLAMLWVMNPWIAPTIAMNHVWRPMLFFLPSALVLSYLGSRLGAGPAPSDHTVSIRASLLTLRTAIVMAVVVPVAVLMAAAWNEYNRRFSEAEAQVDRAVRIAQEHGLKVFESNRSLLARLTDLIGDRDDDVLRADEPRLHAAMKRMAEGIPQLQGIFVIDHSGRMVASDRVYPAPLSIDFSDRPYFRSHRSGGPPVIITEVLTSRSTGESFFDMNVARRRADGTFAGTMSASLLPGYFNDFYRDILSGQTGVTLTLRRTDGTVLAAWPRSPAPDRSAGPPANAAANTAANTPANTAANTAVNTTVNTTANTAADTTVNTAAAPGAPGRPIPVAMPMPGRDRTLSAVRELAPYPVEVIAGIDPNSVLLAWYEDLTVLLALVFPPAAGLAYMSFIALARTRQSFAAMQARQREAEFRRRAEEALLQAQKMEALGRLTGGVAHDFNNLLTVVANNVYLHKRLNPPLEDSKQLAAIDRAIAAGVKLTRQLLSFSRRQPLRPQAVRLQERLVDVASLIKPTLGSNVALKLDLDPATPIVQVDPAELELALINLAINAKDAMPDGGRLTLAISPSELAGRPAAKVSLSDTGQGMTEEVRQHLFEPFFTTKEVGHGTGLGMSQVKNFCERTNGSVDVHSAVGQGTIVTLLLPAADIDTASHTTVTETLVTGLHGLRILLVEDNDDVATATRWVLESAGAHVTWSPDAGDALARWQAAPEDFDVVLSDIVMPGDIDGVEFAARLRRQAPAMPIVLMSGYSEQLQKATELGLTVLPKPSDPAMLQATLRRIAGTSIASDQPQSERQSR